MTQGASDPVILCESLSAVVWLPMQVGPYAKFTPKQKATTPTILRVPSVTLANYIALSISSYRIGRGGGLRLQARGCK